MKQAYGILEGKKMTVLCQQENVRMISLTHSHTNTLKLSFFFSACLSCNENISSEVP